MTVWVYCSILGQLTEADQLSKLNNSRKGNGSAQDEACFHI